jgi:beta-lactamase class A
MPTASLIKFPVMIEAYRQDAEGKIDLETMVTLKKSDQVPGSGILTQLSPGLTLSRRDAARLMIALSDNTATNLVLDAIGIGATAEAMEALGCPNTKIHSKVFRRDTSVFPERSKRFGLGSTTASEMVRLLEKLHRKELVSPKASEAMLEHLKACDDKEKFPRLLPSGTVVAFKTGSLDEIRTAAGIIYGKGGPVALCVLTEDNEDHRWVPDNAGNRLCAEVARAVYDHFNPEAPDESAGPKGTSR